MAWNPPKTWVPLEGAISSDMNTYVRDNTNFLYSPPSARVYNNAAIEVPNNDTKELPFNQERKDTDNIHSTSSNPTRLTCKTPGNYSVYGNVRFASNATGSRIVAIRKNGTDVYASARIPAVNGGTTNIPIYTEIDLEAGDYVELTAWQNSGGPLNVESEAFFTPEFGMSWKGA